MDKLTRISDFAGAPKALCSSCNMDALFGWGPGESEDDSPLVDVRDFYNTHFKDSIDSKRATVYLLLKFTSTKDAIAKLSDVQFCMFLACRQPASWVSPCLFEHNVMVIIIIIITRLLLFFLCHTLTDLTHLFD
jgi:hypothetical protein